MSAEGQIEGPVASQAAQDEILRRMERAVKYNRWMLDRSRPYLGDRVLDAGAGSGTFSEMLADGRDLVVAMEPDPAFVAGVRPRFDGHPTGLVLEGDATELTAASLPSPVDSVVFFNVLEQIRHDPGPLARFREVLTPGGYLLLLVPAHPFLFGSIDRVVDHQRRYRKEALRTLLQAAGFGVETLRLVNPLGAVGWFVSSRALRRTTLPARSLRLYDALVPVLRQLDRFELPFGLSVWAVARRPQARLEA